MKLPSPLCSLMKFAWNYYVRNKRQDGFQVSATEWVAPPLLEGQLWFGNLLVADLHQLSPHQGTWSSKYKLRISANHGQQEDKLLSYIAFSEDFHRKIDEGQDHDFAEFECFTSIQDCMSWAAKLPSGLLIPMVGMIRFANGEVYWDHPDTAPSMEAAANVFWFENSSAA